MEDPDLLSFLSGSLDLVAHFLSFAYLGTHIRDGSSLLRVQQKYLGISVNSRLWELLGMSNSQEQKVLQTTNMGLRPKFLEKLPARGVGGLDYTADRVSAQPNMSCNRFPFSVAGVYEISNSR